VAWALAIVSKTFWRSTDLDDAFPPPVPRQRLDGEAGRQGKLPISGFERIFGEGRQYVREEQLLVLLLMIDAQLDERQRVWLEAGHRTLERFIDMGAKSANLVQRRATQHSAARARVPRAFGFVIAVEEEGIALVERLVRSHMIAQDEDFEKPGRVGEMPFRRRGIREGLDRGIGVRQRRRKIERQLSRREQTRGQGSGRLKMSLGRHQRGPCHETNGGESTKFAICSIFAASRRAISRASTRRRLLRLQRLNARRRRDGPTSD
jgi:hypothetical protein